MENHKSPYLYDKYPFTIESQYLPVEERLKIVRNEKRPQSLDYIRRLCTDFVELHGDRRYGDDPAIVGGLAIFEGQTIMVIGNQRGHNTRERVKHHFGQPLPEGIRKAERLMKHAEKFGFPVLTFVDTQGAYSGTQAEERGIAEAISSSILTMGSLKVPTISTVIGEGYSGGAIATATADRLLMMENAMFSVISPEGASSILFRDDKHAYEAAEAMHMTAFDAQRLGIIHGIVPEAEGGAHNDREAAIDNAGRQISAYLKELQGKSTDVLLEERYQRYRHFGTFTEGQ